MIHSTVQRRYGKWLTESAYRPDVWAIGFEWQNNPASVTLVLPMTTATIERSDVMGGQDWCWTLRYLLGQRELRIELDLHGWLIGVKDGGLHVGPITLAVRK